MKKHVNIPIFIPHLGCPNQCVFCNQRTISGVSGFDPENVSRIIDDALLTISEDTDVEIAFFGGSFTGIDRELMIRLLNIAGKYIESGRVSSIRCSTRPDYINEEILDILEKYNVKVIELGLQSASDDILLKTKRGHDFLTEKKACEIISKRNFELVGQMMIGLPGSDLDSELRTADFIISSGATAARIYPTVVFKDTELCSMVEHGEYSPIALDEAIKRSAEVLMKFINAGIEVIRIGLCASENLESDKTYFAGPNHPALGELVINELYFSMIMKAALCMELPRDGILNIFVSPGSVSKAVGQKKKNKSLLKERLNLSDVRFFESDKLKDYEISLNIEDEEKKCT